MNVDRGYEALLWFVLALVLLAALVSGCTTPAADPTVGFESFSPVPVVEPTGDVDVPLTSAPWECGIPEGCMTQPPTDTDGS